MIPNAQVKPTADFNFRPEDWPDVQLEKALEDIDAEITSLKTLNTIDKAHHAFTLAGIFLALALHSGQMIDSASLAGSIGIVGIVGCTLRLALMRYERGKGRLLKEHT